MILISRDKLILIKAYEITPSNLRTPIQAKPAYPVSKFNS